MCSSQLCTHTCRHIMGAWKGSGLYIRLFMFFFACCLLGWSYHLSRSCLFPSSTFSLFHLPAFVSFVVAMFHVPWTDACIKLMHIAYAVWAHLHVMVAWQQFSHSARFNLFSSFVLVLLTWLVSAPLEKFSLFLSPIAHVLYSFEHFAVVMYHIPWLFPIDISMCCACCLMTSGPCASWVCSVRACMKSVFILAIASGGSGKGPPGMLSK